MSGNFGNTERQDASAITPRHGETGERNQPVHCPFCGSTDAEPFSLFGSQLMTEQLYCRQCHTPFEHLRTGAGR